jgi:actin-like ATPase involved in cell morphogenesis
MPTHADPMKCMDPLASQQAREFRPHRARSLDVIVVPSVIRYRKEGSAQMSYLLGIDLGTTFTAAAVCRREAGRWGPAEVVPLGTRTSAAASVVFVDPVGTLLFGEAAERRVVTDPTSVVREFKRRIGDDTPLLVGGVSLAAHDLAAQFARWVVDTAAAREGGAPDRIALTHPAGWGRHRTSLLATSLHAVGLVDVVLLSEPHAAAICYASTERMATGSTIAVYDLGGGTFDATVLRKSGEDAFELLGEPVGHDRLGGLDFDELVFDHVRAACPQVFAEVSPDDPALVSALTRLRRECTEAKEGLSEDTEVVIPVLLPRGQAQVRLVRAEFEAMIRPAIEETVDLLEGAVGSAGLAVSELTAVLLVGGSARIPLVTELLSAALGRPVAVGTDPKATVALGAVLALRTVETASALPPPLPADATPLLPPVRPEADHQPLVLAAVGQQRRRRPRVRTLVAVGGLCLAALTVSTITGLPEHLANMTSPAHAATTTPDPGQGGGATGQNTNAGNRSDGRRNGDPRSTVSLVTLPNGSVVTTLVPLPDASGAVPTATTTHGAAPTTTGAPTDGGTKPTGNADSPVPSTTVAPPPPVVTTTDNPPPPVVSTTDPPTTQDAPAS